MPKNTSASFVTQNQSWKKKKQKTSFIELPATWWRNITPRDELLAQLSLRKCVLLVLGWVCIWVCIAHLHSCLNTWSLIFLQLAFHVWYRCPPTSHSLQPAEHQKTQPDTVKIYISGVWFSRLCNGWVWEHWCCEYEANLWGSPHSSWHSCCDTVSITPALSTEGCSGTATFRIKIIHGGTGKFLCTELSISDAWNRKWN